MIALYRYQLTSMVLSQRYLPPALVYLAALSVGTSSDNGPLLRSYSFCVAAVLACSTWLAVSVVNHEDPVQRQVTTVAAGGSRRMLGAAIAVTFTGCLFLTALGLIYPILTGDHVVTAGAVLVGAVAQLAAALVGTALGLLTSRLVIPRLGIAMVVAVTALLAILLVRWISPVSPLIRLLSNATSPDSTTIPLTALTAVSVAILAVSAIITQRVADRRE